MRPITYYSTNNKEERANFRTALLKGMGSNYGLYMVAREEIPRVRAGTGAGHECNVLCRDRL